MSDEHDNDNEPRELTGDELPPTLTRFRVEVWGATRADCARTLRRMVDDLGDPTADPATRFDHTRTDGTATLEIDDGVRRDGGEE